VRKAFFSVDEDTGVFVRRLGLALLLLAFALLRPAAAGAAISFEALEELPPGEQYRQLSLLSLVAGGVDPELVALLQPLEKRPADGRGAAAEFGLDDYATPLARIVDQEILLAGAAQMFRFARDNSTEIQARMTRIAGEHPILISMVDVNGIAADAIIIRNAIADSIEYSQLMEQPAAAGHIETFRAQTVHLRNMMEFNEFQAELAQLTEEAIVDLGGRLDAYQRMFDDEVDPELIQRRVESAQIMNRQADDRFQEQALERNAELLMMLILLESQVY
jgi:hypothetical protein